MVQTVRWDPPSLHRFHRAFFLRTDNLQVAQGTLGHSRSTAPPAVHRLQLHHSKPHSLFQDGPEAGGHVVPCDDRPFVSTRQKIIIIMILGQKILYVPSCVGLLSSSTCLVMYILYDIFPQGTLFFCLPSSGLVWYRLRTAKRSRKSGQIFS